VGGVVSEIRNESLDSGACGCYMGGVTHANHETDPEREREWRRELYRDGLLATGLLLFSSGMGLAYGLPYALICSGLVLLGIGILSAWRA